MLNAREARERVGRIKAARYSDLVNTKAILDAIEEQVKEGNTSWRFSELSQHDRWFLEELGYKIEVETESHGYGDSPETVIAWYVSW